MTSRPRALGLFLAAVASVVLLFDLDRPALWLDESASVVATQRSWPHLWTLLGGADAPLVPYYALLKLVTSVVTALVPRSAGAPELLFRLPSLLAAVVALAVTTTWLARRCPTPLVLGTGAVLLTAAAVSRYGQEARPYAFVLLASVLASQAWTAMMEDSRRRRVPVYAATVLLLVFTHLLAASLVAAHLVAAAVIRSGPGRRTALVRTGVGAGLGVALSAPFLVVAATHGTGPIRTDPVTPARLLDIFVSLFTGPGTAFLGIGVPVLLALVGLGRVALSLARVTSPHSGPPDNGDPDQRQPGERHPDERHLLSGRDVTLLATAWAIVPLVVLLPVVLLRPNLMIGRYLIFVVPGWALLAGLGITTLTRVPGLLTHLVGSVGPATPVGSVGPAGPVERPAAAAASRRAAAGSTVAILVTMIMIGSQIGTLAEMRTPAGHGEDLRPALAMAGRPKYAHLPLLMSSGNSLIEVGAYRRQDEDRVLRRRVQRDQASIWPVADPTRIVRRREHPRLVLLLRSPSSDICPTSPTLTGRAAEPIEPYVQRCMPRWLAGLGYRVETARGGGRLWTFAVLTRRAARQGGSCGQPGRVLMDQP